MSIAINSIEECDAVAPIDPVSTHEHADIDEYAAVTVHYSSARRLRRRISRQLTDAEMSPSSQVRALNALAALPAESRVRMVTRLAIRKLKYPTLSAPSVIAILRDELSYLEMQISRLRSRMAVLERKTR